MSKELDLSVPSLFNVQGKIALVSGGGSGIGLMIASTLVANGAKVYICARKEKQLKAAADAMNRLGSKGRCEYITADLSSRAGCDALIAEFKKRENKLHILVNNSGATWGAPYTDFPEKEGWSRVLNLNVVAIFYMTAGLTDYLEKDASSTDPGRVINISSVASVSAHAEESAVAAEGHGVWSYNTSKAAVNHLTSQLSVTLAKRLITVNAILPGIFPSKMTAFGFSKHGEDTMALGQPMGRVGNARDMGGLALFLCSPAGAHVTGQHIMLDGGATLAAGQFSPATRL